MGVILQLIRYGHITGEIAIVAHHHHRIEITVAIEIILDEKVEKRIPVIGFVILIMGNKS